MPEYTLNGEENKVSQQNVSPDFHPWPNPDCAHFIEPAEKNVTTKPSPRGQDGSENCGPVSPSELTFIVPGHHPSPAHSALGAQENANGKQIPRVAPADSASGTPESSWWFGHEDAQAPVRPAASRGQRGRQGVGGGLFTLCPTPSSRGDCDPVHSPALPSKEM